MQGIRSYATEAPVKGGTSTPWIVGAAAVGSGYIGYNFLGTKANADAPAPSEDAKSAAPSGTKKAFTGGDQGFVDLKLKEVKDYNHNTKTFIFELPEADQVSGLGVASAIITKYKAEDQEKPTIRPYTPINAEGKTQRAQIGLHTDSLQMLKVISTCSSRSIPTVQCLRICTR